MSLLYRLLGLSDAGSIARGLDWHAYAASPLPLWAILFIAAVGLAAVFLNLLPQNVMSWKSRAALALIRLSGFLLALLMLSQIELRVTVERHLPPNVALLVDASESMDIQDAGGRSRRAAARAMAEELAGRLKDRARISRYGFAWRLEAGDGAAAAPGATRLIKSLEEALQRENDLQAVLLLSDGNDTGGDRGNLAAPLFAARGAPVYPVIFGKQESPARGEVRMAAGAPYVRLGDEFTLSAVLTASGLEDQAVRVLLSEKGVKEPLAVKENVRIGKTPNTVTFVVKPTHTGEKTYRIAMEGLRGGSTDRRLVAEHRIQVIDAKIRVLYLDIPRDERKILGQWLERDPVVDLASLTLLPMGGWYGQGALRHKDVGEGLPGNEPDLYQYDVIILGDIPRAYFRQGGDVAETKLHWLTEFVARRGGGLVTLGGRSVYGAGNYPDSALAQILPFEISVTGDPQVPKVFSLVPTPLGLAHPIMQLGGDAESSREAWFDLPALDGCNRVGAAKAGATVLAVRPVEGASMPVAAIQDVGKGKVLSLAADTTWRWEMMRDAEAPDRFRRFWGNAVRYLAPDPRVQPGRPQIQRSQTAPAVGETLTLSTRLVDNLFQPVRGAELVVTVKSPAGRSLAIYPRDDRNRPGLYEYAVTLDEPGDWTIRATSKKETTEEIIHAGESDEEMDDPRARPDRMAELATATGGKVFQPDQANDLLHALQVKSRRVVQTCVIALWNLPLTLILFATLVCLDCLIRKRRGMA